MARTPVWWRKSNFERVAGLVCTPSKKKIDFNKKNRAKKRTRHTGGAVAGTSISGNWSWNLPISSSPVTATALAREDTGAAAVRPPLSKSSHAKLWGDFKLDVVVVGTSTEPSMEMSGNAEAARSKSMSSVRPSRSLIVAEKNAFGGCVAQCLRHKSACPSIFLGHLLRSRRSFGLEWYSLV